jgi:predicted O-methyltransferase YrrM
VEANVEEAGVARRVRVVAGDAVRAIPLLPGRFDFALLDAVKGDYLDYLRQLEPRLRPGAVVIADNTGRAFRRAVKPYLEYVRGAVNYRSRSYEFGDDAMEVSIRDGAPTSLSPAGTRRSRRS